MTAAQHPSTKQDILYSLLKQGQSTAQELADRLNISPQAIRRHLKDLEEEGLIEHQILQVGVGRPNHAYRLSREGRDRLPDRYDEFALSLLDTLAKTVGKDQFSDILRKQWEQKALEYQKRVGTGTLQDRVANLVELRQAEGYMAEWHMVEPEKPDETPPHYVITEYNCAISHIAESFPTVCGHELEMFAIALQDCKVERTHWLVNGEHRCGYLIQAKVPQSRGI
ncbi:MAG: iron-sulfur cluster biosynthesis transcriptional regulator SufR [Cyanobacteria bacterium CRU_2_1]|nr:iron-sulfur cluster biosynthesis transcriptional regulator SufR [Cyanobacteria bacterium RU_5_0]NJR61031.1 iron-sulfur cluster biosynthesis transcriptional regulator SufR [Cyanobacteria bacterium CRU_2_1]